jgi:hypothetical protein
MGKPDLQGLGMRPINHLDSVDKTREIQPSAAPNLTIVLRGTQQLQQNAAASGRVHEGGKELGRHHQVARHRLHGCRLRHD